jgi:hypothetical protein
MGNLATRSVTRSTLCHNQAIGDASVSPLGIHGAGAGGGGPCNTDGLGTFTCDGTSVIVKSHATTSGDNVCLEVARKIARLSRPKPTTLCSSRTAGGACISPACRLLLRSLFQRDSSVARRAFGRHR